MCILLIGRRLLSLSVSLVLRERLIKRKKLVVVLFIANTAAAAAVQYRTQYETAVRNGGVGSSLLTRLKTVVSSLYGRF